jgi:hypothetical protein
MAPPLNLLWKVKITTREKMGLAALFSIGVIIIIFAIVRAVQIIYTNRTDSIILSLWSVLESSVCTSDLISSFWPRHKSVSLSATPTLTYYFSPAVIVGCLPPFKSLFTHLRQTTVGILSGKLQQTIQSGECISEWTFSSPIAHLVLDQDHQRTTGRRP